MRIPACFLMVVLVACCGGLFGAEIPAGEENSVAVTVYNDDFAVIKEQRTIAFSKGVNTIKFTDVASAIEPASVSFQCLTSPGKINVLEQNYEYDLVNTAALLNRYIDKRVEIAVKGSGADEGKDIAGNLMASRDGNLIIKTTCGKLQIISQGSVENISLEQLPEDLVTKPTLVWMAQSQVSSKQQCRVTYTTSRIGWVADYSAILNATENALDISGWVTIDNKSGAGYKDAKIKLIAGDVRRIKPPRPVMMDSIRAYGAELKTGAAFEEKAFMEYHLYTLSRPSTINNNQTKQIEFITPAINVPAKKVYLYDRNAKSDKVQVKFEFDNKKENGLGIALAKGKVRVFKRDADEMLEFVGEDLIDHTPRNEKISLYIGDAFDIAVDYKLLDSKVSRRSRWQKHSIELNNRKDTPVTVFADEKFSPWVNWEIEEASHPYVKKDAATARFSVKLGADESVTLEYSVMQRW